MIHHKKRLIANAESQADSNKDRKRSREKKIREKEGQRKHALNFTNK